MTKRPLLRPMTAVAIAGLALLGGWWFMTQPPGASAPGPAILTEQEPPVLRSGSVIGMDVQTAATETVGRIEALLLDPEGRIEGAVIAVGGILGLGEKPVGVTWDALELKPRGDAAMLTVEAAQLREAPAFHDRDTLAAERICEQAAEREPGPDADPG